MCRKCENLENQSPPPYIGLQVEINTVQLFEGEVDVAQMTDPVLLQVVQPVV